MPENLLTKCPHCSTTFRLTQAQLDIAGGAVRCGACYQVFHAAEHIVKTSVVEERRTVTKPPDPVEEAFDLKSDKGLDPYDSEDLDMEGSEEEVFSEDYRARLDPESRLEEFGYEEDKSRQKDKADETWAEELLKELGDDEEEQLIQDNPEEEDDAPAKGNIISGDNAFALDEEPAPRKKKKPRGNELSDTFLSLGRFSSEDPFAISDIEDEEFGGEETSDDESWAKAMLKELEDAEAPPKPANPGLSILSDEPVEDTSPFAARELSRDKKEIIERARKEKERKQVEARKQAKENRPESLRTDETEDFFRLLDEAPTATGSGSTTVNRKEPSLEDFTADDALTDEELTPENLFADSDDVINQQIRLSALEYGYEEQPERRSRAWVWILAMGLLVVSLGAQYTYFHFHELSRLPQLRPALAQVCGLLGCELAPQSDVSRIVGTNLVVRSHPFEKNALVIDVILKNQAQFEQPYPVVQLNFEDVNGDPVASRRFLPEEYISDDALTGATMPPNTPIHLTLEIQDPGREAVNYQLLFLPNTNAG
ncbi:MAG: DUF3426 domain-containing protein [Pseudomonadota bacterium]|nr:hypothetical protein [Pseudomonadales bacterium]MDY6919421.1 DUF3426 domain-containing protein [Pseudomonadota bacterium]